MKTMRISSKSAFWAGLLGTAILVAAPMTAGADQGKWWTPREGGRRDGRGSYERLDRGFGPGWRLGQHRVWRAHPRYGHVYRDFIVVRDGYRGPYFRARRFYVRPYVYHHVVVVRPVRYFIAANACIGSVSISARFHPRDHYEYGCNFCDERFDSYEGHAAHAAVCPDRPDGFRVETRAWDDGAGGSWDDGDWRSEDE